MTKLLIATTIPETIEAFLLPYVYHFRAQGWIVDGIADNISGSSACVTAFHRVWDVPWSRNPVHLQNFRVALPKIRDIVTQGCYDLVHVHTPVASFITRLALQPFRRKKQLKVVYTAHGFHFYAGGNLLKNLVFGMLEQWAGRWTDHLVVINREDEAAAQQRQLVPPSQIVYMPGIGVDLERYSPSQVAPEAVTALRHHLGLPADHSLFLVVAELSPRKRPQDVVRAFAQLNAPNTRLAFAGEGPLRTDLQALVNELQLTERVQFLGLRTDIPVLMRAAVATVLVSRQEGLPRSVMESLALEVPVIGSNIRGTRDLLVTGGGMLVDVGDIAGIAQAMHWVLMHPEAAQAIGKQGRSQMATYDLQQTIRLHQALYENLLIASDPP